ncbi:ABC transporter permease, partial [Mesorhizobium sp. M2A.F.Ca.ET.029.05.1.1]
MAPLETPLPRSRGMSVASVFERYGLIVFLLALLLVAAALSPTFLQPANLVNVLT